MKKIPMILALVFVGLSGAALPACTQLDDIGHAEQMLVIEDAACIAYKNEAGQSAMILENNTVSAERLPSLWRLNELEGSGMTEPGAAGMHVWEGDIDEDEDGNRVYTGSWRIATQVESDALLAGTDPF